MGAITNAVNEAKDDVDHIIGEAQRLTLLLEAFLPQLPDGDIIGESLSIVSSKARRVRASL